MILRLEGLSLCYRDVDLAKAEKHRNKKRKVDDSKGIITVKAYQTRGDKSHIAEANAELGSSGDLTMEYVASILKLSGKLRVSAHGRLTMTLAHRNQRLFDRKIDTYTSQCPWM